MGRIIASCGHDVTEEWDEVKNGVSWMDFDWDGTNAVAHGILCKQCIIEMEGCLLKTPQEESDWLNKRIDYGRISQIKTR